MTAPQSGGAGARATSGHVRLALALALLLVRPASAQRVAPATADTALARALTTSTTAMIAAHLGFLADDLLEGRAPGTFGAEVAARYIAAQFAAAGLKPGAPDGSFFHRVRLVGLTPDPSLIVGFGPRTAALRYGEEFVAWPEQVDSAITVDGELVFVGYGIQAPEWDWDDYKGTPLTGKILLMLVNDPGLTDSTRFQGKALTYYGRWTYKLEQAARLGAIGAILIHTDESATYPWSVVRSSWSGEQVVLEERPPTTLRFGAWLTETTARRLVEETGKDFELLLRRAQFRDFRPIALGAHTAVHIPSRVRRIEDVNVIARRDGADSVGRREAVLFTAHYDHLGIGPAANGDSIYNGAVDNASGVATLLAAAAGLAQAPPTRRSILFIATTAEEAGLLGAEAYVRSPAIPLELTAAAINIDRANVHGRTRDAVALGAERSTLGRYFERAAAAETLTVAPDPSPERGSFYRSDHFPFARAGVPVLSLRSGSVFVDQPEDWGAEQERQYVAERYHQPGDEISPDFAFDGALQQARLMIRLGWALATVSDFPTWNPDSEFRPAGERLRLRRGRATF